MDWQHAVVWSVGIAFALSSLTVIVVSIMKVGQVGIMADSSGKRDSMMRQLAEEATSAQRRSAEELTEIRLSMVDLRERVTSMERMMREVG